MLNRKGAVAASPAFGFARATNEGMFIRRVSAFADESKRTSADEVSTPDWASMDTNLRGVSWSADNLSNVQNQQQQRNGAQATGGASITHQHLESPKNSFVGTHTRCTGGGTGEAGPSSSGSFHRMGFGCDPNGAPQSVSPPSPARKATQNLLARQLAERNLYSRSVPRSIECVASQLRTRDVTPLQHQQQQQHQQHPHAHGHGGAAAPSSQSHHCNGNHIAGAALIAGTSSSASVLSLNNNSILAFGPATSTTSATTSQTATTTTTSASSSSSAISTTSTVEKLPSFIRTPSAVQAAAAIAAAAATAAAAEAAANGPFVSIGSSSFGNTGNGSINSFSSPRLPDPSPQYAFVINGANSGVANGAVAPWVASSNKEIATSSSTSAISATNPSCLVATNTGRALTPVTGVNPARPSRHTLLGSRQQHQQHQQHQQQHQQHQHQQQHQQQMQHQQHRSTGSSGTFYSGNDQGYPDPPVTPRPRASTGSIAPSGSSKHFLLQQQQQQLSYYPHPPPPPPPPSFTPRLTPSPGLIHLWSGAPAHMRRSEWSMAQYAISRQLYGGYASSVFKARCMRSGQDVVLKVYTLSSLSDFLRNQVLRELDIHSRLDHPHVVQMLAAFREGDKLVLVLEYVRGGSLDRARRKLGGRMSEQQAVELVMVPLLRTLHYLHTRAIVHRDIKPENLLFTSDWKLKVCDYGVSVCLSEERAVTRTGSRDYMAPEVQICPLKRTPEDNKNNAQMAYTTAVDIWSVGVLTYEILVGFTAFPGGPPPLDDTSPNACRRLPNFPSNVSADARAFVVACLSDAPGDRPTIFELLKHRWVHSGMGA